MAEYVGFIGTGIMGEPMALNLVKAGYQVSVYNRTHEKTQSLAQAGARVTSTPSEAAQNADYVMSIVSDSAASEEVILGKEGVLQTLKPGAILIDSATISPVVSRRLACATAGKKANFLDAPVTGSKHGAEKGELTFMIGGERETFERALQIGRAHV